MGVYAIKPWFRRRLEGSADALGRRTTPDRITSAGVMFSVAGGTAIAAGQISPWWWLAVPILALLRTAANALDGLVAQRTNRTRPAGELWNETADRLGDICFFAGVAALGLAGPALAALALAAVASFVGVTAKAAGASRRYDGPMGKPDRMLVISIAALASAVGWVEAWEWAMYLIAAGAILTALNRYRHAKRELEPA